MLGFILNDSLEESSSIVYWNPSFLYDSFTIFIWFQDPRSMSSSYCFSTAFTCNQDIDVSYISYKFCLFRQRISRTELNELNDGWGVYKSFDCHHFTHELICSDVFLTQRVWKNESNYWIMWLCHFKSRGGAAKHHLPGIPLFKIKKEGIFCSFRRKE